MPAQRKKRTLKFKVKRTVPRFTLLILLSSVLFLLSVFIFRTDKWNGKDKLSLVVRNSDSSVSLIIFDPTLSEIHNFRIPADTEVKVAGGYGVWKIGSLWILGEQEKLSGLLLARSITMGFKMPVYAWADAPANGLSDPGLLSSLKSILTPYKSNLSFRDKLGLIIFSSKIKNSKRININLEETAFLERQILAGGEEGFRLALIPSQRILTVFSEPYLSSGVVRVSIKDGSQDFGIAKDVGSVIEVLGAKVFSIENTVDFEGVCKLKSKDKKILEIFMKVFECEENSLEPDFPFDIEIVLGKDFGKKY